MKKSSLGLHFFSNVQILSAFIWAFTILACSWFSDSNQLSTILITAAGFHVILLERSEKRKREKKTN